MAKPTRYRKNKIKNAHAKKWEPTDKQKELVALWGVDGNTPSKYHDGYSQEDRYRLELFLDTIQAGNLDNLETEPGQFSQVKAAILDFKEEYKAQKKDWLSGPNLNIDDLQHVADSLQQTNPKYKYLKRDLPGTKKHLGGQNREFDKFDIPDSATMGLSKLDPKLANQFETSFIDDLYGTERGEAGTEGFGKFTKGALGSNKLLGLDLVRDTSSRYFGKKEDGKIEIGTHQHYEHMTRGEVDWGHYRDDKNFAKAFKQLHGKHVRTLKGHWGKDPKTGKKLSSKQRKQKWQENVQMIRDTNSLLAKVKAGTATDAEKEFQEWTPDDWKYERSGDRYTMKDDGTPGGRLYKGNEMQISFNELMTKGSGYYIEPGKSKTFVVGQDADGHAIRKTYKSPIEIDLTNFIYDPSKKKYDQTKDHVTPGGIKIEAQAQKKRDVKRPEIDGISWKSGSPKLTNPTQKASPPVIKPISSKSYAQN